MKLLAGTPTYTPDDHAIVYIRKLGYSKVKTRKLLKIDTRKFKKTCGQFGGRHEKGMHTKYKEEKDLLIQLKRTIVDLGLHHELTMDNIKSEIEEVVSMVQYGKDRRKK